jgi:hypothetical protein
MIDKNKMMTMVKSGRFFSVKFKKITGEITCRSCKGKMEKFLRGGERTVGAEYLVFVDTNKQKTGHPYISVRPENILRFKCGNIVMENEALVSEGQ